MSCANKYCKGKSQYDYDLLVIGGGPGGLATAMEASSLGAKVALLNHVTPTPRGTTWGIGGTSINVGSIPKKIMHQAALLGEALEDARSYGWNFNEKISHDWVALRDAVQHRINEINFEIEIELKKKNILYVPGKASFQDSHTLVVTDQNGKSRNLTSKYILIAVGARPKYPEICGAQKYGITSDDFFSLDKPPGKTLIIGSECIGMETAGFLQALGSEVTIMEKSGNILSRYDQQVVEILIKDMEKRGIKFLYKCEVKRIFENSSKKIEVSWINEEKEKVLEHFDTIIFAIGREVLTDDLNLGNAGVKLAEDEEKIETINEQTNVGNIYAVGDVLYNKPASTAIARRAGIFLARRLFGESKINMDYELYGKSILTPLEYAFIGISEEEAIKKYTIDKLEIYHSYYRPFQYMMTLKYYDADFCYLKVVALREGNQNILGMHFIGPNSGEVVQGFATAMKCGLTVNDLLINTVAIHTTNAEEFIKLSVTKRSGIDPYPGACCS